MVLPNNERTLSDHSDIDSARGSRFQVEEYINIDVDAMRRLTGGDTIRARRIGQTSEIPNWIRFIGTVPVHTIEINIEGSRIDESNGSWIDIWNELHGISRTRIPQCTRSNHHSRRCAA